MDIDGTREDPEALLTTADIEHLERVAPRYAQAGLRDWALVVRLLQDYRISRRQTSAATAPIHRIRPQS